MGRRVSTVNHLEVDAFWRQILLICVLTLVPDAILAPITRAGLLLLVTAYTVAQDRARLLSTLGMYVLLVGVTALPLAQVYFGERTYLLTGVGVRANIQSEDAVSLAILAIMAQTATLSAFLRRLSSHAVLSEELPQRYHWISVPVLLVAIGLFSVLANPSGLILEGLYGSADFLREAALGIGGWNLFFIFAISIYTQRTRLQGATHKIALLVTMGFWLLHGNRGEVLMITALLLATYAGKQAARYGTLSRIVGGAALAVVALFVFQVVGEVRGTGLRLEVALAGVWDDPLSVFWRAESFEINTLAPVAYTLLAVIYSVQWGGWDQAFGASYLDYAARILPASWLGAGGPEDLSVRLIRETMAIGGAHFGAEPFLNFGLIGVLAYAGGIGALLTYVANRRHRSAIAETADLAFLLVSPRVCWYGFIYLFKTLLLLGAFALASHLLGPRARTPNPARAMRIGRPLTQTPVRP